MESYKNEEYKINKIEKLLLSTNEDNTVVNNIIKGEPTIEYDYYILPDLDDLAEEVLKCIYLIQSTDLNENNYGFDILLNMSSFEEDTFHFMAVKYDLYDHLKNMFNNEPTFEQKTKIFQILACWISSRHIDFWYSIIFEEEDIWNIILEMTDSDSQNYYLKKICRKIGSFYHK